MFIFDEQNNIENDHTLLKLSRFAHGISQSARWKVIEPQKESQNNSEEKNVPNSGSELG